MQTCCKGRVIRSLNYGTTADALVALPGLPPAFLACGRQGFYPATTMVLVPNPVHTMTSTTKQQRFVQSTQWLRPVTRWATRFSLNSPQWLPAVVRHAPLKLTSLVLRGYHLVLR